MRRSWRFHDEDCARYHACAAGEIFRPRFQPAGVWLQVDDFVGSPIAREVMAWVADPNEDTTSLSVKPYFAHVVAWWRHKQVRRAAGGR